MKRMQSLRHWNILTLYLNPPSHSSRDINNAATVSHLQSNMAGLLLSYTQKAAKLKLDGLQHISALLAMSKQIDLHGKRLTANTTAKNQ
jgi:hypothetical protein